MEINYIDTSNLFRCKDTRVFDHIEGFFDFLNRYASAIYISDEYHIKLNRCSIESVKDNPDLNFYFILKTSGNISLIASHYFFSNDTIVKYLKEYPNFYILFISEHESTPINFLIEVEDMCVEYGISPSKIIVMDNNHVPYNSDIIHYQLGLIPNTSCSIYASLEPNFIVDKKGKLFVCHNRGVKPHRYSFIGLLMKTGLIDDINWSFQPENIPPSVSKELSDLLGVSNYVDKLIKGGRKYSDYEDSDIIDNGMFVNQELLNKKLNRPAMESGGIMIQESLTTHENSYINIVTETFFEADTEVVHITEKTFRPFGFYQIPIFVSTPHHVKVLRDRYKFDLFDDIINHSYDEEVDDINRMNMIIDEIRRINSDSNKIIDFYKENKHRFEYNRNIVKENQYLMWSYDSISKLI